MAILIISKSQLFREMLLVYSEQRAISVSETGSSVHEIKSLQNRDLVLLHMSTGRQELENDLSYLRGRAPKVRIILLTSSEMTDLLRRDLLSPVNAIIPEDCGAETLFSAVVVVKEGFSLVHSIDTMSLPAGTTANYAQAIPGGFTDIHPLRRLSKREGVILSKLTSGISNKDIGRDLGICETTVKVHLRTCYQKIGAKNRTQAALWAATYLSDAI